MNSSSRGDADRRALPCPRCGALNGADFDRCVRCGAGLSRMAASADRAGTHVGGHRLWATRAIIAVTSLVFVLEALATHARTGSLRLWAGGEAIDAIRFGALFADPRVLAAEPWRVLSAVFVHAGLLHVGMNLLSLANLGRVAEPAVGSTRFLVAYVVAGVVGFTVSAAHYLAQGQHALTLGASGAVLGVMGVILGLLIRRRDPAWKRFAVQTLFYGVAFGFIVNSGNTGIQIDNAAHIGGLITGIAFGAAYGGRPAKSDLAVNLAAGVAVTACIVSLLLAQLSPLWRGPRRGAEGSRPEHETGAPASRAPRA